jgi:hypothetical protein
MDTATAKTNGHSADVRMDLHVNGHVFGIGQMGPNFLILRDAAEQPPGEAELAMSVDGDEERWRVRLVDGICPGRRETRIARCEGAGAGPERGLTF